MDSMQSWVRRRRLGMAFVVSVGLGLAGGVISTPWVWWMATLTAAGPMAVTVCRSMKLSWHFKQA